MKLILQKVNYAISIPSTTEINKDNEIKQVSIEINKDNEINQVSIEINKNKEINKVNIEINKNNEINQVSIEINKDNEKNMINDTTKIKTSIDLNNNKLNTTIKIKNGLILFVSFHKTDNIKIIEWMATKVMGIKMFNKWTQSVKDRGFEFMVVEDCNVKIDDEVCIKRGVFNECGGECCNGECCNRECMGCSNICCKEFSNGECSNVCCKERLCQKDTTKEPCKDTIKESCKETCKRDINIDTCKENCKKDKFKDNAFNEFCKHLIKLYDKDKIKICPPGDKRYLEINNDGPFTSIIEKLN